MIKRILIAIFAAALLAPARPLEAGSIGDFLKAWGRSISHPEKQKTKSPPKKRAKSKTTQQQSAADYPPAPTATPPDAPSPTPAPTQTPVRPASAPAEKNSKRDLPYAIPVPNKPGFVTSPYAPKAGYVDVRGFASGSEVKDPYTGKVFLIP